MATKTIGTGGDYATFAAAVSGIATWDRLDVITAGTYAEAGALAFAKTVEIANVSGGQVTIQTPLGSHVGQTTGTAVVTWTGDFVHEIRKPGSGGTEYVWLLSNTSKLILDGVTLKSDYTTGNTQAIYAQNGTAHELTDCTLTGTYEALITLADSAASSVIDGLTIDGLVEYVVRGNSASAMFGAFDWRRIVGQCTRTPMLNAASGNRIDVTTTGYMGGCVLWGMTATGNCVYGSGTIAIDKCTFDGAKAYAFEAVSGIATGLTFRDVAFAGFSACGVRVTGATLSGLVDYCGRSNGCPALTNSAGSEGAHNVTADPLFTDYAGHDYRILATSPYKDAGTTSALPIDPDGVTVPQGAGPDIGAYEFFQAPPLPQLERIDSAIRHATNMAGTEVIESLLFELVPESTTNKITTIKSMLMVWAGIDRRVDVVELPDSERDREWPDRRGWWGDPTAGNRIWRFAQRPLSRAVDDEMQLVLMQDLEWLTAGGFAASYDVTVTHTGKRRDIEISVKRLDGGVEAYGIDDLWAGIGG